MFGSTTLQTPKSGRSRFSKALPAPPSFPEEEGGPSLLATPVRQLPASPTSLPFLKELPPIDLGPPLPPPKAFEEGIFDKEGTTTAVKPLSTPLSPPLNSPLPPLPQKSGPQQPPTSIPRRRPVGAPAQAQPQTPTVTLAPAPVPAMATATAPAPAPALSPVSVLTTAPSLAPSAAPASAPEIISPNPLPSPATSLSSLLSAYTDHTSESTPRTSTNSTNNSPGTKEPQQSSSPNPGASRGTDSPTLPPGPAVGTNVTNEESLPPPVPVKDSGVNLRKPQPQPQLQSSAGLQNVSPIESNSSTEQLWRRRSVKSDKNIAVPELKLTSSNGSTVDAGHITASISSQGASSGIGGATSVPTSSQVYDQTASSIPSRPRVILPKSSNAGLPGKNIRPVASRQQIRDEETMGKSWSKLNDNGPPARGNEINKKDQGMTELGTTNQHSLKAGAPFKALPSPNASHNLTRLPTPDYENNEARGALSATVVSPVSPASSPELPIDSSTVISPSLPHDPKQSINQVSDHNPALSNLNIPRQPVGLPSSPAASRFQNRHPAPVQSFPARTSSKAKNPSKDIEARQAAMEVPASLQIGTREAIPPPASNADEITRQAGPPEPERPLQDKKNSAELGVSLDASLPGQQMAEGEVDENMTDNPGAALFPRDWFSPLPADGVMDALPLTDRHFRCITSHRYMTANKQRYNPIACATCGHRDRLADAHICSACHLNVCGNCSVNLRRFRGNLHQLLDQIREAAAASAEEDDRTVTMTQEQED
ncbi:hypothetical protein V8F20_004545 [Naviculisporaceae sp. PSN 640]